MAMSKASSPDWHTARLGLVGEDRDSNIVGITCDHVTLASDGHLYMDDGTGHCVKIATINNTSRKVRRTIDVDCFKLTSAFLTYFTENPTEFQKCRQYKGDATGLYGKLVFRQLRAGEQNSSAVNRIYGRVASSLDHEQCVDIVTTNNFLVLEETPSGRKFAAEGNSGDFVAIEEDGCTTVVGIITSGNYVPSHREGKPPCTICLLLGPALDAMCTNIKKLFTSCVTLLFKSPEQIEPLSFNLADRLVALSNIDIPDVCLDTVKSHLKYEKSLSATIDSRTEIKSSIFREDDPLQVCIISHAKACEALYSDRVDDAETHLKTAAMCLHKADPLILLLLSKLLVAAAWYFRMANNTNDAKAVLEEGTDIVENFKDNSTFPCSSEFYIYFEYSQYYKGQTNHAEAARYTKLAMEHSRETLTLKPSSTSAKNRHMLAVCQYAERKLKCGKNFETHLSVSVSQDDVDDVARYMSEVESMCADADLTAQCFYLLQMCDLLYRQHDLARALVAARHCHDLATRHGIRQDREHALARIEALTTAISGVTIPSK